MDLNLFGIGILLGVYVGVVPVYLGLFSLPLLQRLRREWLDFLVCLTLGIMLFLFVDVTAEALEAADKLPAAIAVPADGQASVPTLDKLLYDTFGADSGTILGPLFMLTGFALGVLGLVEFGRRLDRLREAGGSWGGLLNPATLSPQMQLALLVSLGIGLHNLGEGLAVGVAYGSQSFALATVLIFGFAVHNVSEGIAIVSPISLVRRLSAAAANRGLAMIRPPRCRPLRSTVSSVTAVPASTTQTAPGARLCAASMATHRSTPRRRGSE